MSTNLDFKEKEYITDIEKLRYDYKIIRCITASLFSIQVDNSKANSHNINIDYPIYNCFAINESEAVGLMVLSDFAYKNLPITRITAD